MKKSIWKHIFVLGLAGLVYFLLPGDCPEAAKRTAFVFVIAALYWAFEIIPLYATSLVVVLLLTFLLAKPGGVLGMDASGYKIFFAPFASPVMISNVISWDPTLENCSPSTRASSLRSGTAFKIPWRLSFPEVYPALVEEAPVPAMVPPVVQWNQAEPRLVDEPWKRTKVALCA